MLTNNMNIESLTPKERLIAQLDALILTMQQVAEQNGNLNMYTWLGKESPEPEHFCGSAACICGYQALSGRLELFPVAARRGDDPEFLAHAISHEIGDSSAQLFDSSFLARSIYTGESYYRYQLAESSGLFTEEELDTLVHLNSTDPEPQDVIDYLNVCKQKVEDYNSTPKDGERV